MDKDRSNNNLMVVASVVAVFAALGIILFLANQNMNNNDTSMDQTQTTDTARNDANDQPADNDTNQDIAATTITFTDDGFSPNSYTVKKGTVVTVKNNSSESMQFSSDDHPQHQENSELNLSVIQAGQSGTFTPTTVGTWGFHDHLNERRTGTLVVTE